MRSIAAINTVLPTVDDEIEYMSGVSLRDYDIAIFDPELPYDERITFSGGGSCLSIEATQRVTSAMAHWAGEIRGALQAGKTVFVLLNEFKEDLGTNGYNSKTKNHRTYNTLRLNNYDALPFKISIKNSKGRHIILKDSNYRSLFNAISDISVYKVIFENNNGHPIFSAKDGAILGSINRLSEFPGHIVFLPYFNFFEYDEQSNEIWSERATRISQKIVSELIAIDKNLRGQTDATPVPPWVDNVPMPREAVAIDNVVSEIDAEIAELVARKEQRLEEKQRLTAFSRLLYENGKILEATIENALQVLGFKVENYRSDDLEIDHIIVGPSGLRMVGESEGKDTSAIDVGKFRQLESNINEDFQRESVEVPAKGILFANGFRFTEPSTRPEQFTSKCMTNAKRLQTALVRTSDLYEAVIYALDHPEDDAFRADCRMAIESSRGEIVVFPAKG